jgi:predicted nucleic acid-binding protein
MLGQVDQEGPISSSAVVGRAQYILDRYLVAHDSPHVLEGLLKLMLDKDFRPRQIHDANVVATMLHYGINTILSNDVSDYASFARYVTVISLEES